VRRAPPAAPPTGGVDDATENSLDKTIVNDAAGRVLRVSQTGNKLYTQLVNGQIVGQFGVGPNEVDPRTASGAANFAQVADFGFGYRSVTGSYPAASVGSYTVRQGDSLQGIAQAAYGDAGQWLQAWQPGVAKPSVRARLHHVESALPMKVSLPAYPVAL
jgi:nucleoid-associated protein YgaU